MYEDIKNKLNGLAKSGHRKCYGRGYIGYNKDGSPIPCKCAMDNFLEQQKYKEGIQVNIEKEKKDNG